MKRAHSLFKHIIFMVIELTLLRLKMNVKEIYNNIKRIHNEKNYWKIVIIINNNKSLLHFTHY